MTRVVTVGSTAHSLLPTVVTLSHDRTSVAVFGSDGVTVVDSSGGRVLLDDRPGLIAPGLDPYGFVWTVAADSPGALLVTEPGVDASTLSLPVDGRVVALRISRDGARVLLGLDTVNGPRVTVMGIQRNADLVPVAFGTPYDLDVTTGLIDVAGVDGTHVAVLESDPKGATVVVRALGGPPQSLGDVDAAVSIVAGNLVAGIRVLLADGSVLRPSYAGGWRGTGLVASFLGTQQ